MWDWSRFHDDGSTINSYALIGPIAAMDQMNDIRFSNLNVEFASSQSGGRVEVFTSSSSDNRGVPMLSRDMGGGNNPMISTRARGSAMWVGIQNNMPKERWSLEGVSVGLSRAGRKRVR